MGVGQVEGRPLSLCEDQVNRRIAVTRSTMSKRVTSKTPPSAPRPGPVHMEQGPVHLGVRWTDEQLSVGAGKVEDLPADETVQLGDGCDLVGLVLRRVRGGVSTFSSGMLERCEPVQRLEGERLQGHRDGEVPGWLRKIGPSQVWRGPERGEQIAHQTEVLHLLATDEQHELSPVVGEALLRRIEITLRTVA